MRYTNLLLPLPLPLHAGYTESGGSVCLVLSGHVWLSRRAVM